MTTVVVSPLDVVSFPDGAGHFWVYMQYVQGLRRLGCDVYWLEQVQRGKHRDSGALATFRERMECFGMAQRAQVAMLADRKSTRLNSSHVRISYAVFCLKKKTTKAPSPTRPSYAT